MEVWTGAISNVPDHLGDKLGGLSLHQHTDSSLPPHFLPSSSLEFQAIVDPSQIPLHIIAGPPLPVSISQTNVESWFRDKLVQNAPLIEVSNNNKKRKQATWYEAALPQSSAGILAKVQDGTTTKSRLPDFRVTEILFYAVNSSDRAVEENLSARTYLDEDQTITLLALPLSSDLLYQPRLHRPPTPPQEGEAYFYTSSLIGADIEDAIAGLDNPESHITQNIEPVTDVTVTQTYLEPHSDPEVSASAKKRGHLTGLFDEADERRKKSRHKGGVSVSLAASRGRDTSTRPKALEHTSQVDHHSQSNGIRVKLEEEDDQSWDDGVRVLSVKRKLSGVKAVKREPQTPNIITSQPEIIAAQVAPPTVSTLEKQVAQPPFTSKASASTSAFSDTSFDTRNKQIVSRTVMACMRMHGLEQRSRPRARSQKSAQAVNSVHEDNEDIGNSQDGQQPHQNHDSEKDNKANEEYKQLYHQTYKGTLFAFRNVSSLRLLNADEARTVAHQLLEIFCALPPE